MEVNLSQAKQYFGTNGISVCTSTIAQWIKNGYIEGWQDVSNRWYTDTKSIDNAIQSNIIPPKLGLPNRYTEQNKQQMKVLRNQGKTLLQIATQFSCDESYVSLVIRDKR